MNEDIDKLWHLLQHLDEQCSRRCTAIESTLQSIDDRNATSADNLWKRVQQTDDQYCNITEALHALTERISSVEQRQRQFEQDMLQRLDNAVHEMGSTDNGPSLSDVVDIVETRLTKLQSALLGDIEILHNALDQFATNADTQQSRLTDEQVELRNTLAEHVDTFDSLHSTIDDIRVTMQAQIQEMHEDVRMDFERHLRQVFETMQKDLIVQSNKVTAELVQLIDSTTISFSNKISEVNVMIDAMRQELLKFTSFRKVMFGHKV